ncbi:hypothetical protein LEP1GSC170_5992 [Leptospira interrogans serovar Bataviae str. HAI135]|nr:hypothetical protein LEP1GSC170_5992 [Leptospira interrogans serovar Bataviae str. HAI135]
MSLFSQDGEEIDFLEKVTEPKKTVSKKSSNTSGVSSGTSTPKKKEKKRSKKKRSKKSHSFVPNNLEETQKKNVIPNNNETSSGNNNSNSGSSNTQVIESGNVDEQRANASKIDSKDLPKPYWVNEEVQIHPNNLPGYTVSQKSEQGSSFGSGLSEILKLGEDKKKKRTKRKFRKYKNQVLLPDLFLSIKSRSS